MTTPTNSAIGGTRLHGGRLALGLPAWRPRTGGRCPACGRRLTPVRVTACDGHHLDHYDTWRCPAGHPT